MCTMLELPTGRSSRMRFTLIELLVVVAVIAILVALLMPVLGRVRRTAKKVVCVSNMRQQGVAVTMYAEQFDEKIPPYYNANLSSQPNRPHNTYMVFITSNPKVEGPRNNLACLLPDLITPDVLYCPAAEMREFQKSYYDPWPSADPRPGKPYVRVSYNYNPHRGGDRHSRLRNFDTNDALCMDVLHYLRSWSHNILGGYNLLYADGRVEFRQSDLVAGGLYAGTFPGNSWGTFNSYRDDLEE